MSSGKMRRMITVQAFTDTPNEAGTPVKAWTDKAKLRAEVIQQSTTEFIRNAGASDESVVIFRTRFIDGVENADRVLFAGEPLNIKEIAVTGHNRGLEIRCVRQS